MQSDSFCTTVIFSQVLINYPSQLSLTTWSFPVRSRKSVWGKDLGPNFFWHFNHSLNPHPEMLHLWFTEQRRSFVHYLGGHELHKALHTFMDMHSCAPVFNRKTNQLLNIVKQWAFWSMHLSSAVGGEQACSIICITSQTVSSSSSRWFMATIGAPDFGEN